MLYDDGWKEGDAIPEPSAVSRLKVARNQFVALIEVWMPPIRDEMAQKAIKKTLTLPKWLNDIAEEKKVNFSQVLQNALISYLGLKQTKDKPAYHSLLKPKRRSSKK